MDTITFSLSLSHTHTHTHAHTPLSLLLLLKLLSMSETVRSRTVNIFALEEQNANVVCGFEIKICSRLAMFCTSFSWDKKYKNVTSFSITVEKTANEVPSSKVHYSYVLLFYLFCFKKPKTLYKYFYFFLSNRFHPYFFFFPWSYDSLLIHF